MPLAVGLCAGTLVPVLGASAVVPGSGPRWVREYGNSRFQRGEGIAITPDGDSYVAATTYGTLPGSLDQNAGKSDAVLAKYNGRGHRLWTRQLGSQNADEAFAAATDTSGNAYVAGYTYGTLPGSPEPNAGGFDAFVAMYDSSGSPLWVRQLGGASNEFARAVATNAVGDVYVAGYTYDQIPGAPEPLAGNQDAFIAKYDGDGNMVWVHGLGTRDYDAALGVATDPLGGVDIAGYAEGALPDGGGWKGQGDAFIAHYADDGSRTWVHQFGSASTDTAYGVDVDQEGRAFVAGATGGKLPGSKGQRAGSDDIFIATFAETGDQLSARQLGSPGLDYPSGVAIDGAGNAYVSGSTPGTLPGSLDGASGATDAFLVKFGSNGYVRWVHQLGTTGTDVGYAVAVTPTGTATLTGFTEGTLPGSLQSNAGGADIYLAEYRPSG